ncbi:hypothetical protein [Amycolatopsis samaneae]|uniref:Peptidase C14 n=1 Tax=Amycolatopsis samaneae TaxID=664691 RepID=A0ABW5GMG4_9PSEU
MISAESSSPAPSRRALLAGMAGAGGMLVAGTALAPAANADPAGKPREPVHALGTVKELLDLDGKWLQNGALASVAGYFNPGDGGGGLLRWDAASATSANGGTVLAPAGATTGRWLAVHNGVFDFRRFGIFDAKVNADAALDAMVNDPAVSRVEAHTDLNFVKRHTFGRSTIELDFGGHTITAKGIEPNTHDNPFGAVLYFRGQTTGNAITFTAPEPIAELSDVFPVADSGAFTVGDWYAVEVNPVGGKYERELQKLFQITQIVDRTHIRVGYQNGWPFAAGRTFTWTRTSPVTNVRVTDMNFVGVGGDELSGAHPLAFEYAVRCDVSRVHGTATFWPVIMRRWNTHFRTRDCSLVNPPNVEYGGAGYLTQQIYCLYGHVEDCHTSNARHLNDWTASAYCYVTNCHGDGDDQGPFVTHGQYEHDLVYTGCSGLMTFANSGAAWGSSAKRITVRRHVCSWFVARVKVTDLTLEDVQVIGKPGLQGSGMIWVNADGVQLRGCQASDTFIVSQSSNRSGRPNVISGCAIPARPTTQVVYPGQQGSEIVQGNVSAPLHFDRCAFTGMDGNAFNGTGELRFTDCVFTGAPESRPVTVAGDLAITGGSQTNVGFVLTAARDQRLCVGGGATVSGTNAGKAFFARANGKGVVTWSLADYRSGTADAGTAHVRIEGGVNRYQAGGVTFTGGAITLAESAFAGDSYLLHTGNVESGVHRTAPPAGPRVRVSDNLGL